MGKHRYASGKDRVLAFRARQRAEAAHRLDAPTQPVVAVVDHADALDTALGKPGSDLIADCAWHGVLVERKPARRALVVGG